MAVNPAARAFENPARLQVPGGTIDVSFESDQFDLPRPALLDWVTGCARAVSAYYGRFPVTHARLRMFCRDGRRGVSNGTSWGYSGALSRIFVGQHATEADLKRDWILTHEMVHYGFPSVADRHHWIEEGAATYVEPIARAQVGDLTAEQVWGDMVRDMPQGLPEAGDQGLDSTHTWGRTYWGGAIFCLVADVGIRKHTANKKGLEDALRAVNRAGGTIDVDWPLEKALEIGDRATGGKVLMDSWKQMGSKPVPVDLPDLWKQLGVSRSNGATIFDDAAPLAPIRAAILQKRS